MGESTARITILKGYTRKVTAGFLGSRFKKTEQWCFHLQLLTIITATDKFVNPSKILFYIKNSKDLPQVRTTANFIAQEGCHHYGKMRAASWDLGVVHCYTRR